VIISTAAVIDAITDAITAAISRRYYGIQERGGGDK